VADLDARLKSNAEQAEQQEGALQRALDEAGRLKKLLKSAAKERAKLRTERGRAAAAVGKKQARAEAAEAKYDQAVLQEIVRREKEKDRAAAHATDSATSGTGPAATSGTGAAGTSGTGAAATSSEQPTHVPATVKLAEPPRDTDPQPVQSDPDPAARTAKSQNSKDQNSKDRTPEAGSQDSADPPAEESDPGTRNSTETAARNTAARAAAGTEAKSGNSGTDASG
jgi:hypothetical protein